MVLAFRCRPVPHKLRPVSLVSPRGLNVDKKNRDMFGFAAWPLRLRPRGCRLYVSPFQMNLEKYYQQHPSSNNDRHTLAGAEFPEHALGTYI